MFKITKKNVKSKKEKKEKRFFKKKKIDSCLIVWNTKYGKYVLLVCGVIIGEQKGLFSFADLLHNFAFDYSYGQKLLDK